MAYSFLQLICIVFSPSKGCNTVILAAAYSSTQVEHYYDLRIMLIHFTASKNDPNSLVLLRYRFNAAILIFRDEQTSMTSD